MNDQHFFSLRDRSLPIAWENAAKKRLSEVGLDIKTGERIYGTFDDWMKDVAETK